MKGLHTTGRWSNSTFNQILAARRIISALVSVKERNSALSFIATFQPRRV
jgi:hypothetical protein